MSRLDIVDEMIDTLCDILQMMGVENLEGISNQEAIDVTIRKLRTLYNVALAAGVEEKMLRAILKV
jgi:hypothetical protein